ncbi:MAG: hypothetical protein ABL895_00175 [Cyclobacteriaceae bacterium]
MRLLILILFWSTLLYSCKEITFREPQPAGIAPLREVPSAIRGPYATRDKATGETGDTLIIESWGYHFKDKEDKDWLGKGKLSDTLVVKFYENYYFVNFKEGDQWVLRLIKEKSPGVLEFMSIDIQDDSKRKEMLRKISRKVPIKEIDRNDDTFYQINPTPAQLMGLIKDGFFTGIELRKIK